MASNTIHFHIGTHKTGTTALQKFFMENKKILQKKGYVYDFYNESEMNQGYLINPTRWDGIEFDKRKNYIISGEDFYHHILTIAPTVKKWLAGFKINFIVYLKRQDLMKQSVYNQIVKMHGFFKSISEDNHYRLDYYGFLKELGSTYPDASITVRVYEREQFVGGTIYSDFLNVLNLELTDEFQIDRSVVNPSLTRDKLEFSRYINMLGLQPGLRTQLNRSVVKTVLESEEAQLFRRQDLLSPREAMQIINFYSDGNKKIAEEYLHRSSGELFKESAPDPAAQWTDYPGLSAIVAREIVDGISVNNRELLEKLYAEVLQKTSGSRESIVAANFLMPVLADVLKPTAAYEPRNVSGISKSPVTSSCFSSLTNKIGADAKLPDILREVAVAFEGSGDIETAAKLMAQAYYLRPDGPVIKRKYYEYQQMLNKKKEHLELDEGRATIDNIGHRSYVGGYWDEIGKLQFEFLVSQSLKPHHVLLDIACGALRGGVHFIKYLDRENYLGLDKEPELIRLGIAYELGEQWKIQKHPQFVVNDRFDFSPFSKVPDYSIAQSLFTHLIEDDIHLCLTNLRKFVGGRPHTLFATFFETDEAIVNQPEHSHSHVAFFYTKDKMMSLARDAGWKMEYVGDWGHPRGQRMLKLF